MGLFEHDYDYGEDCDYDYDQDYEYDYEYDYEKTCFCNGDYFPANMRSAALTLFF